MWHGLSMPRVPPKKDHPGTLSLGKEFKSCAYVIISEERSWTSELTCKAQGKAACVDLVQEGSD